jgi:hypothetical protein
MNETKLDILKDALEQVQVRTALLIHQNTGRWNSKVEHDMRTMNVLACNMRILTEALEAVGEDPPMVALPVSVPSKEETTALVDRLWGSGTDDALAAILAIRSRDLEIRKLQKEHADLAASQCLYGQVGDEHGHFECTEVSRLRHNVRIVELDRDRQMERAELLAKEKLNGQ